MASPEAAPETALAPSTLSLPSASLRADGKPRFMLILDRELAARDHGLRYLVQQETRHDGFERSTRDVIDAHLQPGDLFIDIGAHVGVMSLTAATAIATVHDNPVLAIEPSPDNLRQLRAALEANGLAGHVDIVEAAIGAETGRGRLTRSRGSMGHRLNEAAGHDDDIKVPVFALDDLLERYPQHAGRRVVLKIRCRGRRGGGHRRGGQAAGLGAPAYPDLGKIRRDDARTHGDGRRPRPQRALRHLCLPCMIGADP